MVVLFRILESDFFVLCLIFKGLSCFDFCLALFLPLFLLVQVLLSVWADIDFVLELEVVIELHSDHPVKVELESLERRDHVAWQFSQACTLQSVHLLVTLLALILVLVLQQVSLDQGLHTLIEGSFVLDWHSYCEEWLRPFVLMGAGLANDLVRKLSAKVVLDCLCLRCAFYCSLKSIKEHG